MVYCRKCGIQCLDCKVRKAHEEKCTKGQMRKNRKSAAHSTTPWISDHGYASNISTVHPTIDMEHNYANNGKKTLSKCIESCTNASRVDILDHSYTKPSSSKYLCRHCGQRFRYLQKHKIHENQCTKMKQFCCRICGEKCENHKQLYVHRRKHKIEEKQTTLQVPPWEIENNPPPWSNFEGEEANKFAEVYNLHRDIILQGDRIGSVVGIYNIPLDNGFTINTLMNKIAAIYAQCNYTFRINFAFSSILQNVVTKEFRYFQGYRNNALLEDPPVISNSVDLIKLKDTLERKDIFNYLMLQRTNTKHKPVLITNVQIWTYNTKYVLGHEPIVLPSYLSHNNTIMCFNSYKKHNKQNYYTDNLCAFRNLCYYLNPALFEEDYVQFEVKTLELFTTWVDYKDTVLNHSIDTHKFKGIELNEIPYFEDCFRVNVFLFEKLDINTVIPVYKSTNKYDRTIQMNVYNHHLSLILDFNAYAKKFKCRICNKLFDRHYSLSRHEESCNNDTKLRFKGGFYKGIPTIFEELDLVGIHIKEEDRFYPWFIVYDFEAILEKVEQSVGVATQLTNKHIPISVGVCSNFKEYRTPKCIMNANYGELINKWFLLLNEMHSKILLQAREKWNYVSEQIDELLCYWAYENDNENEKEDKNENGDDISQQSSSSTPTEISEDNVLYYECEQFSKKEMHTLLIKLQEKFEKYINTVPVIGFNSSKYDILLCRTEFTKNMGLYDSSTENPCFVIKKGETYPSISNDKFIFLDLLNFLAPGYSYSHFLKAYNVTEKKLFFPYEYISSVAVLNETSLPPHGDAWYSSLKQKSVLDDGNSTIIENYEFVKKKWEELHMNTLWDLLAWYNMGDVAPFVNGIEAFLKFYYDKGIDIFKIAISTPGIARKLLTETAKKKNIYFSIIDAKNKDLFFKIRNNLTGGPSIIFNRHLKVDETLIRGLKQNKCKSIVGWDAASLYLYCMSLEQPSGIFIRRRNENKFRPELRDKYVSAYHWMDWIIKVQNKQIKHLMNSGKEKRIGPFLVDGYDVENDVSYEFYGCYFHGHKSCFLSQNLTEKEREKRYTRTMKRESYIRQHCRELIVIWECEYTILKPMDKNLQTIIDNSRPPFYRKHKGSVTFQDILQGINNDLLYGFIECDISAFRGKEDPKNYDYFSEMSPIFCTTEVSYEHFGSHMKKYVEEQNLSKRNRTLLVGGMSAKKILLHSKLLKWYLNHGMNVSHIYEVIEFTPTKCFTDFTNTITSARREAEQNPDKQIIGQTFKIIGNSGKYSYSLYKLIIHIYI